MTHTLSSSNYFSVNQAPPDANRSSASWMYQSSTIERGQSDMNPFAVNEYIGYPAIEYPVDIAARNFQATIFWEQFTMEARYGIEIWNESERVIDPTLFPPTAPLMRKRSIIKSTKRGRGRPVASLDFEPIEPEIGE
jgi:hypothetical protein